MSDRARIQHINIINPVSRRTLAQLLESTDYYEYVDLDSLGGHWYGHVRPDGTVVTCIWVAMDRPFAYLDYLAANGKTGHGLRLGAWLVDLLLDVGFTRILGNISQDNVLMMRAMSTMRGGINSDVNRYMLVDFAEE